MPQGDRTGPRGMGPMTGRGMGYCRWRSPNAPFRGDLKFNQEDLRTAVRDVMKEFNQEKKKK